MSGMAVTGSRGSRSNRGTESSGALLRPALEHHPGGFHLRESVHARSPSRDRPLPHTSGARSVRMHVASAAIGARATCNLDQWMVSHTKIGRRTDGNVLAAPRRAWQHDRFMRSTSMRSKNDTTVSRRGTARCNDLASPTAPPLEVAAWVIAAAPCSAPRLPARSRLAEHSHGH